MCVCVTVCVTVCIGAPAVCEGTGAAADERRGLLEGSSHDVGGTRGRCEKERVLNEAVCVCVYARVSTMWVAEKERSVYIDDEEY